MKRTNKKEALKMRRDPTASQKQSLLREYLRFASATVASLLTYSLYSMVDGLFVARGVSEYAMSAVNLALPYTNVLFSIAVLFGVGSSTLIAIHLGQNQKEEASRLFTQNTIVLLVLGGIMTGLVYAARDVLPGILGADAQTEAYTRAYLTGLAPFSVCFMISYSMEILIKTDGYPQKAFWTVLTGCVLNCVMDYAAIYLLDMGVRGAALATGLSQFFVCLIYLCHFLKGKTTFCFTRFRFRVSLYRRLIPIGLSDGVTELFNGLMIFVFNRVIQQELGADGLVCYTIIAYVNTVVINGMIGVSGGAQPLISFYHGRREPTLCRKLLRYALMTAAILGVVVFGTLFFGGELVIKAFLGSESPGLRGMAFTALRRYASAYLLLGLNVVIGGYLTAREKPAGAMGISAGRGFALQAAALLLLSKLRGGDAVWFAPLCGESICLLFAVLCLRRANKVEHSGEKTIRNRRFQG